MHWSLGKSSRHDREIREAEKRHGWCWESRIRGLSGDAEHAQELGKPGSMEGKEVMDGEGTGFKVLALEQFREMV